MPHCTLNCLSRYRRSPGAQGSISSEAEADVVVVPCCCSVTGNALGKCQFVTGNQLGFPGGSAGKESACSAGDLGLIPGLERSPGEGNGYPLQYSGLESSMDRIVHGVTKSQTQLRELSLTHSSKQL